MKATAPQNHFLRFRKEDTSGRRVPEMELHSSLHHPAQREWSEPHLHSSQLIYPLFVTGKADDVPIKGFDPNIQWGAGEDGEYKTLVQHLSELMDKGLRTVMLFGVVADKAPHGPQADHDATPVIQCTKALRTALPDLMVACDVCLCEYTDHGHCGILREVDEEMVINNKATLKRLTDVAIAYAKAGAHMVCPSDMMDNRVAEIRRGLNEANFPHVSIMAYTSKKASCMYAPFRDAVESTFKGNRNRYQHPVGSTSHAMLAFERDVAQGADSVIVKPSLFYGDIIREFASRKTVPVVAYIVSGEYKMLMDYGTATNTVDNIIRESHLSLLRAGCSVLITYFTPRILDQLQRW